MSPEAQRIAIAEACGARWQRFESGAIWLTRRSQSVAMFTDCERPTDLSGVTISNSVPDYLDDLNAMHEAEKVLTPEQRTQYALLLHDATEPAKLSFLARDFMVAHATAAQRAEAVLRTLGKWEESQ